tara:strand:- start:750 stop:884 length:135 start_codon:yes stop_codon:yes gene_type:complete
MEVYLFQQQVEQLQQVVIIKFINLHHQEHFVFQQVEGQLQWQII